MQEPVVPKAALRREPPAEIAMHLAFSVQDPDVIAEVQRRPEGAQREEYLRTALRIGVLAMRQAGGTLDGQTLRNEGERLVEQVEGRLREHASTLNKALEKELKAYFDPSSGHFQQRVKALVSDDGELARVLKSHLGDNGTLAQQMALAVGTNSPLMRHLSPEQKDGLIATITRTAQERLEEQSRKVLGEFDLNNPQGALKRLIGQIETNFNPDDPRTALGVLKLALEKTQDQIRKDLTLDDKDSALRRLQETLRKQIDDLALAQQSFQNLVSEKLGIKQVQSRTTEGGFEFEHHAAAALQQRAQAVGDQFQSVGEVPGKLKRKTGDHEHIMGAESAAPNARIVYECKRDKRYRVKVALEEMAEARKNREAGVGVFVMSARTLRENPALKAEYPAALARYDNDVIAVWDDEDPATDVVLDAAVGLARAMALREARGDQAQGEEAVSELSDSIADIEKQFERFDKMSKWCDDVMASAKEVSGKAYDLQEELRKVLKRLQSDVKALDAGLKALGSEGAG